MEKNLDFESEIVISGISGRFPMSDSLDEFWENLIEGKNMVSENHNRYSYQGLKIPAGLGVLKSLDKFDADFFSIHEKQATVLDPRLRKLLEVTFETIIDAGRVPSEIQGTNTGVFVAVSDTAAGPIWKRSTQKANGYIAFGTASAMIANRVSFAFDVHGPSYVLDSACSAASVGVQHALHGIRTGLCDAAIVGGVECQDDAQISFMLHAMDMTSMDGKCKVCDDSADGYARAEAAVAIYVCKKQVAKRAYARLVHVTINNDGYKDQGITFPSEVLQEKVIRRVYEEIGMDPREVDYVEIHGTGTKVGDVQEMKSVTRVFCEGRQGPLLVGSVKSNMGHPEPAAGLCAIAKVLLSHVAGIIPANLHYHRPNADIPALHDGRAKIVDKNQPFNAKFVGINSMGFGGTNVHILLKLEDEIPQKLRPSPIPLILMCSGRTEDAVKYFLDKAMTQSQNQHFVKLLHELSRYSIRRHPHRGYVITDAGNTAVTVEKNGPKDSIWFIFTGIGSQWEGMSRDMVKFRTFKTSIVNSAEYLSARGFDLISLLESGKTELFEDLKNGMVSIASVQVALVDLLKSIGIHPDGIIGQSAGEVPAGYADGCLTQEETVLTALARARAFTESGLPPGTIASVGLTWEEAGKRCPEGVYPAIHNGKENVSISGPREVVEAFMSQLSSEGIFTKGVHSGIYGFHSPWVYPSAPVAKSLLSEIILEPKPRSTKWLSTSLPEHLWNSEPAKYCSAEYLANNGNNPVHFYPALLHIPENALVLEIAPHCFMYSLVQQSIPKTSVSMGLNHVKSPDNCEYFLNTLGKCYLHGINMDVGALYEPVQLPVNSKTPNISSMIKWDHSVSWSVPHNALELSNQRGMRFTINLAMEPDAFFEGHLIDGKIVFPATGYLWLVWRFFSSENHSDVDHFPVVFENVRFERITFMNKLNETEFLVNILNGNGKFEVVESEEIVCTGEIRRVDGSFMNDILNCEEYEEIDTSGQFLTKDDFYKEMRLRGLGHSGQFQGIQEFGTQRSWSKVLWSGHWVSFLDAILQTYILQNENRDVSVPIRLKKLTIDPVQVKSQISDNQNVVMVKTCPTYETGNCPGLEIRGLKFTKLNQRHLALKPTTTEQVFIPYLDHDNRVYTHEQALASCLEIALDNSWGPKFVFTEILGNPGNMISHLIVSHCGLGGFNAFDFRTVNVASETIDEEKLRISGSSAISLNTLQAAERSHLVFTDDVSWLLDAQNAVLPGGFILTKEYSVLAEKNPEFVEISEKNFLNGDVRLCYYLFRKQTASPAKVSYISVDDTEFEWVRTAKQLLTKSADIERLIFMSASARSGIIGFIKCLVKEATPERIRCYHAIEPFQLNFDMPSKALQEQFQKDLLYNVYDKALWGYFVYLGIPLEEFEKQRPSPYVYANELKMGELSSLSWIQSRLVHFSNHLIQVHFSSLNFKDVMLATGRLGRDAFSGRLAQDDSLLGVEFSGTYQGKRVFGMNRSQCLASHVDPSNAILFNIPNYWTHEDAASVPVVYSTVYLALILRGRMTARESVLIHAGSGGVGQAAIALALSMNCQVFTTVSSQSKRDFLKARFPRLTPECFASSRDARDFLRHIKKHTQGKGVNLVLNSLAQEKLRASIECLSTGGRFLEIGKFDLFNDTNIGLSVLLKGASIYGILADQVIEGEYPKDLANVRHLIPIGIDSGVVQPLNATVFKHNQLETAFRFMAQGKHVGKVLVHMKEMENEITLIPAYPRTYFHGHKAYIIVGGLGGMGFELAKWMVHRGAKKLVLVSRTGSICTYHGYHIGIWESHGATIVISQSDASTIPGATSLLHEASKLGPVGGIFNTAVLLKDRIFENQTPQAFNECGRCKADVSESLDTLSRQLAPDLDYFVVFSSVVCGRGNPAQTNYGYCNSVMERICEQRQVAGFPALAIQWGAVADVGALYRQTGGNNSFAGCIPQRLESCLETLDLYLQQDKAVVSSFLLAEKKELATLHEMTSIVNIVAHVLGIKDPSKMDTQTILVELGMDSLMTAELSNVLSSKLNIQIPTNSIGQLTLEKLALLEQSGKLNCESEPKVTYKLVKSLKLKRISNVPVFKMKSFCTSDVTVFFVHPLDGTMQTLELLIENLDVNVYGIECVKEAPLKSIEALAQFYLEKIREIQPVGPYTIAGYSFGGAVAFEMAKQLERQNESVPLLLLLDSSPIWKQIVDSFLGGEDEKEEWENVVLFGFLQQFIPDLSTNVLAEFRKIGGLEGKWKFMIQFLTPLYPDLSIEDITDFLMRSMARMECGNSYVPEGKVKASTVLVKGIHTPMGNAAAYDYGLSEVCEGAVEVVEVEGNHYCFYANPMELDLPVIFNRIFQDRCE